MESTPGRQPVRLGQYLLLEKLATGGMAQLYRARSSASRASRRSLPSSRSFLTCAREGARSTAFIDEAKLAALLNHQNVVQIYDFGTMEDSYFISMEFLFGKDLRATLARPEEKGSPWGPRERPLHLSPGSAPGSTTRTS